MQNVSLAFQNAMREQPYIAKIILEGAAPIQGDPIKEITFTGGANDKGDKITIGSTVASMVEIQMEKPQSEVVFKGKKFVVELGLDLPGGIEWLRMGTYKVTDVQKDDDSITVKAMDPMAAVLDVDYEPLPGFDFTDDAGVSSIEFLSALCDRRGVQVDMSNLHDLPLCNLSPEGYTERQIIGMLAALYGTFAVFDRSGILCFRWYLEVDANVTGDEYYESGMEIADYDFSVQWLKCYVEAMKETITMGDAEAGQGIYFECPWMTEEQLQTIWEQIQGFTYRPVKELRFFGDPRLDPGDVITLEDCGGDTYSVPVMAISHDYDGGIITDISAGGQAATDTYEGPVKREANRTYAQILKKVKEIDLSIRAIDGDKIIALINLSEDGVKIEGTNIKLEGTVTANSNFKILADGSMETIKGKIAGWTLDDNSIRHGNLGANGSMWLCRTGTTVSPATYDNSGIGDTAANQTGWCITVGNKFGVLNDGATYMSDLHVTGGTIKIKFDHDGTQGYVTTNDAGLLVTSLDYKEGESGCAMKYGSQVIQCEVDGNTIPMIQVGYYEDNEQFEKVLVGRWVIESIASRTIDDIIDRIEALEDILGY